MHYYVICVTVVRSILMAYAIVRKWHGELWRCFRRNLRRLSVRVLIPKERENVSSPDPAVADRIVMPSNTGRFECELFFYAIEMDLWRNGREHWLMTIAKTAANKLDAAGAFGPYEFSIRGGDGTVNPYVFLAQEI